MAIIGQAFSLRLQFSDQLKTGLMATTSWNLAVVEDSLARGSLSADSPPAGRAG